MSISSPKPWRSPSFFSAALTYNLAYRGSSTGMQGVNYIRHEPALLLTLSY